MIEAVAQPPCAPPVVTQLWLSVEGETTSLFDDTIQWSGTVHLNIRLMPLDPVEPSDPYIPNEPYRVLTNVVKLVGVSGLYPGRVYRATGADLYTSSTPGLTSWRSSSPTPSSSRAVRRTRIFLVSRLCRLTSRSF